MISQLVLASQPRVCMRIDDTQIFASAEDPSELIFKLNSDLDKVNKWLKNNKLQSHLTKTKLMFVGSKHNLYKINDSISPWS